MLISPTSEAFEQAYTAGAAQVLSTRLVADLETPVSAMMKLSAGQQNNTFLLESVEGGAVRGRYSMIGLRPDLIFRADGNRAARAPVAQDGVVGAFEEEDEPELDALRTLIEESRIDLPEDMPPMSAGVFGYLSYDIVRLIERLPNQNPDPLGVPDILLIRPTVMVVFDAVLDEITIVTPVRHQPGLSAAAAYSRAADRLNEAVERLDTPLAKGAEAMDVPMPTVTSNTSPDEFAEMVEQAKRYIRAGDIFQVVLSQRFEAPFPLPDFALYRALRRTNPAPFLFYLSFDGFTIVGSSPEILVRARDGEVTIRPIAGTRPRGDTPASDRQNAEDLLADPKERAEHLMLLDLGRNDVGRVAKMGTVKVTDQFFIERYSHVMHIVSNVTGELDETRFDALDALGAGFPAGTVSGAPKVRAMEIIDELEKDKRGIYAGCVGYFDASGAMDTCIVLRTAVVKDGVMYVQAGAGIVADSDPDYEQAECINKARALFRAAEEAVRFTATSGRGQ
ncbi:MAG: anthranilate synthase component I [Devosiaceae bacterium]|nr:anthranilate synthase component I [Devosiaceae bacterium MH13]